MAEKTVRKTTAKKAVRRTTTKKVPARTTVARTAAVPARKAPVVRTVSTPVRSHGASGRTFLIGMVLFLILLGVSAAIGYSDKGQLDVEQTIAVRKQNATPEEQQILNNVPTQQQQNNIPNGGLIGVGKSPKPEPVEPVSTSTDETASSSEVSASSTEEAVQDAGTEESASTKPALPTEEATPSEEGVQ